MHNNYLRHGDELGVLLVLLTDVGEAAEDEHAHDDHQHQQTQLLVAEQQCCYIMIKVYVGWWLV